MPVVVSPQVMVALHQPQHSDQFVTIDSDALDLHGREQIVQTDDTSANPPDDP